MAAASALLNITEATQSPDVEAIRELFQEYAASLGVDLCFQGFDEELAGLPGMYVPPAGRLLLGRHAGEIAGCVALRPGGPGICEMKRLYVRPLYRGSGLGRLLAERIIHEGRHAGYTRMRLDSLPSMEPAIHLYRRLGFQPIAPYTTNPVEGAVFLELQLDRPDDA
jgi:ribosomal protein S18 acetylase RimI-like enzyme